MYTALQDDIGLVYRAPVLMQDIFLYHFRQKSEIVRRGIKNQVHIIVLIVFVGAFKVNRKLFKAQITPVNNQLL